MADDRRSGKDRRDPENFKIKHILPEGKNKRSQVLIHDEDVDIERRDKKHKDIESKFNPKSLSKSNPKLPIYNPGASEKIHGNMEESIRQAGVWRTQRRLPEWNAGMGGGYITSEGNWRARLQGAGAPQAAATGRIFPHIRDMTRVMARTAEESHRRNFQVSAKPGLVKNKIRGKNLILGAGLALASAFFAAKDAYGKAEEKD